MIITNIVIYYEIYFIKEKSRAVEKDLSSLAYLGNGMMLASLIYKPKVRVTLEEIHKTINEGRGIVSKGLFTTGYGVTTELADFNRMSKNSALTGGLIQVGVSSYRVVKGGSLVAGGLGTCAETLGGGCAVALVGAGNVVLGASDGIEGIQQIGHITGYNLVSRVSTTSKYPIVEYKSPITSLSLNNYFKLNRW